MNDLVLIAIILFGTFPLAAIAMRMIFQKSFMFKFSLLVVSFIYLLSYSYYYAGHIGPKAVIWVLPVNLAIGAVVFVIINKMLRVPMVKSIADVNELSKGNLTLALEHSADTTELGSLNNSILHLQNQLESILGNIATNANNLAGASQQVSSTSQQLSNGANEQASAIEEVSSTMEEISANINQNTDNAQQTEKISDESLQGINIVAERSGKAVEASKVIADKITIVNDIAFQTNILALNAAVEAARAGEHGKGFAVVAAEVRKLAERSKQAADEIVTLAKESLDLAQGAGEVMMETLPKLENTSNLVREITAASMEQNNGAAQVNNAIQQLNGVTQQNAASSEELATSSEELAAQAEQLKQLISFFVLQKKQTPKYRSPEPVRTKQAASATASKRKISTNNVVHLKMDDNQDNEFESF